MVHILPFCLLQFPAHVFPQPLARFACLHRKAVSPPARRPACRLLITLRLPRFAEVEAVLILTMLIARYKVEVKEEPQFAGETFEERKARILSLFTVITIT